MRSSRILFVVACSYLGSCDVFLDCDPDEQESVQEGHDVTWLRCPLGQCWIDNNCVGVPGRFSWDKAMDACPQGWRLPTREDFLDLLGECEEDASGDGTETCGSCGEECNALFGLYNDDHGYYWSSTEDGEEAWSVYFNYGNAGFESKDEKHWARCVKL